MAICRKFTEALRKNRNGWIVCFGSVMQNINKNGPALSFGIFIAEFKRLYQRPLYELDWIAVLVICLTNLLSPIPTLIIRRMGRKGYILCSLLGTALQTASCLITSFVDYIPWLFLTFGFLFGLGSTFILMTSSLIICEFFPMKHKFHVIATSLYQCGFPLGVLIYTPLCAWLVVITSWRVTFRIIGCILFVSGIISSLMFLLKEQSSEDTQTEIEEDFSTSDNGEPCKQVEESEAIKSKWLDIVKSPERICWLVGLALTFASQVMSVFNLSHYMEDKGYGKMESSRPLTFLSLFEFLSYLVAAPFGNRLKGKLVYSNILSALVFAILLFYWGSRDPSYNTVVILSSMLGVCLGITFTFMYAGSGEAMTMDIDIAWTATCSVGGVGSLLGPLFWGGVYELKHSYSLVFVSVGVVCFVSCLFLTAVPIFKYYRCKKTPYENLY